MADENKKSNDSAKSLDENRKEIIFHAIKIEKILREGVFKKHTKVEINSESVSIVTPNYFCPFKDTETSVPWGSPITSETESDFL